MKLTLKNNERNNEIEFEMKKQIIIKKNFKLLDFETFIKLYFIINLN